MPTASGASGMAALLPSASTGKLQVFTTTTLDGSFSVPAACGVQV